MHLILFDHCFWMELSFLEPIMSPTVHILNYIRMCLSHHHFNLQLEQEAALICNIKKNRA